MSDLYNLAEPGSKRIPSKYCLQENTQGASIWKTITKILEVENGTPLRNKILQRTGNHST